MLPLRLFFFFFFNDTATTEIYTLSLHDALPISMRPPCERTIWCAMNSPRPSPWCWPGRRSPPRNGLNSVGSSSAGMRSEEHTSELQSQSNLVCRLLLEKKKKKNKLTKLSEACLC